MPHELEPGLSPQSLPALERSSVGVAGAFRASGSSRCGCLGLVALVRVLVAAAGLAALLRARAAAAWAGAAVVRTSVGVAGASRARSSARGRCRPGRARARGRCRRRAAPALELEGVIVTELPGAGTSTRRRCRRAPRSSCSARERRGGCGGGVCRRLCRLYSWLR